MWELSSRNENKQWTALGDYPCMADAARRILELENDASLGFFFKSLRRPFYRHNGYSMPSFFRASNIRGKSVLSAEA